MPQTQNHRSGQNQTASMPLAPRPPAPAPVLLAALLIALRLTLSLLLAGGDAPTSDEPVHLVAGLDHLDHGSPRLNPEHPPLSKLLAAVSTRLLVPEGALSQPDVSGLDQWTIARQFLSDRYSAGGWLGLMAVFWAARLPTVLAEGLLLVLLFTWARGWYGATAGLLTLGLACLEPTLMGHGALVTTDVLFTGGYLWSLYLLIKIMDRICPEWLVSGSAMTGDRAGMMLEIPIKPELPSPASQATPAFWSQVLPLALALGSTLALTLGTKFSSVLLLPVVVGAFGWLGLRLGTSLSKQPAQGSITPTDPGLRAQARARVIYTSARGLEAAPNTARGPALLALLGRLGLVLAVVCGVCYGLLALQYGREPLVAWLAGFSRLQPGWHQFLLGEISTRGWYSYFVLAALMKEPPALLLLLTLALASLKRQPLRRGEVVVLLAALLFSGAASYARIGIGLRHILPVLMLGPLLIGRLLADNPRLSPGPETGPVSGAGGIVSSRRLRGLVWGLVLLTGLDVGLAWPHPLAYGSPLVGGAFNLYQVLSDSNLDWGQDYGRLQTWAAAHAPEGMLSCVFTAIPPEASDLKIQALPGFGAQGGSPRRLPKLPERLYVAVSALNLQGVYFTAQGPFAKVPAIAPDLYAWLLDRPVTVRLTPSIWIWDISRDADALYRLGMISLRFGWVASARQLFERYLTLRPEDQRVMEGLKQLPSDP